MQTRSLVSLLALATAAAVALTGCASGAGGSPSTDGELRIVASTNVYGDIAAAIAGGAATVTSIMDDPAQDPHSFEASAQNQLAVSKADVVIENGGGYDDFMDTMLKAAKNDDRTVLNAVELSGKKAEGGELNEHVWYDLPTVKKLADALADALGKADPDKASTFTANAAKFDDVVSALEARTASLKTQYDGKGVAVTEPVPLYLLEAMGLSNKTPEAFSEAVEEGNDVSPAVLKDMLDLFHGHAVAALVYNEQTTGPETERVLAAAKAAGVPVVPVTETLPAGKHYVGWMGANIDAVAKALGS
ncbi:zinc ABC transporter substrate-binding protein [Leifsonia sp. F6_8S_P_1B]|uniref:Zinc ABC transporter substrate-binding protein n=1 Tax=Leifsonia williamsii TaxID=3035919 RepID=A0ABT8K7M4_9MICO|nr:zinc ABC transporter substrate-binding protein [Leifsonia williamsii]MDN4613451.1 zinc ABC transporter substrate-binding protein [Leifsonia williamsii]